MGCGASGLFGTPHWRHDQRQRRREEEAILPGLPAGIVGYAERQPVASFYLSYIQMSPSSVAAARDSLYTPKLTYVNFGV